MTQDTLDYSESGSVESVICALQKVISLLDRIKNTIQESSGKIPKAAVQLNTVTRATEMATVEILNVLDAMAQKIEAAEGNLASVRKSITRTEEQARVEEIERSLREVKDNALTITIALQVQDITAQKIAAVNHLIESVRVELLHELNYFQSAGVENVPDDTTARSPQGCEQDAQTFDKNASYRKSAEHQQRVDEVILAWKEKQSAGGTAA